MKFQSGLHKGLGGPHWALSWDVLVLVLPLVSEARSVCLPLLPLASYGLGTRTCAKWFSPSEDRVQMRQQLKAMGHKCSQRLQKGPLRPGRRI